MDTNQRVIDYVKDIAEYVQTRDGRISASQMLERFLFTPDMQYTPISKLSGGEKRRLYLLSVLVSGANVLILDEPSNNVDIPTLTVLEDFLNTFVASSSPFPTTAISWITSWTASSNSTETEIFCSTRAATPITSKQKNAVSAEVRKKRQKQRRPKRPRRTCKVKEQ